jgi:hypothetical protein
MAQDNTSDLDGDEDASDGSVSEAAAKFEAMLSEEDSQVSAALPGKGKKAAKASDEDDEPVDNPLLDDEDDEEVVPGQEDDEDEEEDEPAAPVSRGQTVTVTVDGEELQVPLEEALAGYSRNAAFTKKSQKLADERRTHEVNVAAKEAELRAQSEHYNNRLAALEEALAQPEPDWNAIQRDQPDQFSNIHAAWQIHKDNLAKLSGERQVEQRKLAASAEKARGARVDQAVAKAGEVIPEWIDTTDKGVAHRKAVYEYGIKAGFSHQELIGIDDAKAIVALNKAYLYDKAVADKAARLATGKGKVEALKAGKTLKPGAQNTPSSSKRSSKARVVTDLKARAKKSGSTQDAADAIEAMLG